jgi:hypothetical protein
LTIYQAYANIRAMDKQNKQPNTNGNIKRRLATGVVIAAAAIAGAAQPASAQPNRAKTSAAPAVTEAAPAMTAADLELNLKAQQNATALAERIMETAASHPGSTSVTYEQDTDGNKLAVNTIVIPADTQFGSNKANYTFTVIAPTAPDGTAQLGKVEQLTMTAGASGDSGEAPAPNIQLGFQMNPATGAWGVSADYSNTLTNATESAVVGIDPVSSTVPRMDANQLSAMFKQGMEFVSNAEHGSSVGDFHLPRIFNQSTAPVSPTAPTPNSGGTSAPIETGPGGGTPAS